MGTPVARRSLESLGGERVTPPADLETLRQKGAEPEEQKERG